MVKNIIVDIPDAQDRQLPQIEIPIVKKTEQKSGSMFFVNAISELENNDLYVGKIIEKKDYQIIIKEILTKPGLKMSVARAEQIFKNGETKKKHKIYVCAHNKSIKIESSEKIAMNIAKMVNGADSKKRKNFNMSRNGNNY